MAAQLLRQAGFKVDLQAMDWQTLVGRRAKKDPPDKGGWHMFLTAWNVFDVWSPIANPTMDTRGEKSGWFGWASDDKLHELRNQFMRATDEGDEEEAGRPDPRARVRDRHARAARRVRPADGRAQEHQRLLRHQREHLLEPEEAMTAAARQHAAPATG